MREALITIFIALGTGLAGSFSGWIAGRKRQAIQEIDMAIDTWQKVVDSLEKQVDSLLSRVDELSNENLDLKKEVGSLKASIEAMDRKKKKDKIEPQ